MGKPKRKFGKQKNSFLRDACLAVPWNLAELISDALNPDRAPRPVRRLRDFTAEERRALARRYNCAVPV